MQQIETVEAQTGPDPVAAVIWLHGLGADAHDFEPVVPMLDLGATCAVRYVFPNAPVRPVTLNGGMRMRAWYDVAGLGPGIAEDAEGLESMATVIDGLIDRERERGIRPDHVLLAGFSQGGAMALFAGLRHPERLAGLIVLSGYLPLPDDLAVWMREANQQSPIFMAHGDADPVLPLWVGRASRDALTAAGCPVRWRSYPMMHTVLPAELEDVRDFLAECLAQGRFSRPRGQN
jgi:phospholipase/carboxylesterase